jgi:hypothetical protein
MARCVFHRTIKVVVRWPNRGPNRSRDVHRVMPSLDGWRRAHATLTMALYRDAQFSSCAPRVPRLSGSRASRVDAPRRKLIRTLKRDQLLWLHDRTIKRIVRSFLNISCARTITCEVQIGHSDEICMFELITRRERIVSSYDRGQLGRRLREEKITREVFIQSFLSLLPTLIPLSGYVYIMLW